MTVQQLEPSSVTRWAQELVGARQIAEVVSATEFVPKSMRDRPDVVTAAIMYGGEIGVSPMAALQGIHVVEGRPAPSAELMRGLILRAGHTLAVHEMSGTRCRVSGLRAGRPEGERLVVEWTVDMARAAGLLGRQVWQRYPRAMLLARATSDLARILFPDAIKGLGYIAEDEATAQELEAWAPFSSADPAPATPPEQPARPTVQRRTTPRARALEAPLAPPLDQADDTPIGDAPEPPTASDSRQAPPLDPIDQPVQQGRPDTQPPKRDGSPALAEGPPPQPHADGGPALPDLEPEQPAPEPPTKGAGPIPIGDGVRRGILAAWRRVAPEDPNQELNRMRRLEWMSHVAGRQVESTTELLRHEGLAIAAELGKVEAGDATIQENAEGWLRVVDWPDVQPAQQPPEEGPDVWGRSQVELPWGDEDG